MIPWSSSRRQNGRGRPWRLSIHGGRFLDFLFPRLCPACSTPVPIPWHHPLCKECMQGISMVPEPLCTRCGTPFKSRTSIPHLCSKCIENPGPVDWARSFFVYQDPIASLIKELKYRGDRSCLNALETLSRPALERILSSMPLKTWKNDRSTCVVPVPLHVNRLRQRMFNQSLLIARRLFTQIPVRTDIVSRTVDNPPQTSLSGKRRLDNVRNIFEARSLMGYRHFIIVDDVVTTGSTVYEMAQVLKKKGARSVLSISIARTM